jgi:AAA domain
LARTHPARVVYIDGEMPACVVKERFSRIVTAADFEAPEDNLRFVIADLQPDGLPDPADPGAQQYYDDSIKDAELIILDNLSTLCRSLKENEADSYGPVQEWSLRQRAAGRSVVIIHHANKTGSQRGSNRKEDVLDTVVELRRPPGYGAAKVRG